MSSNNHPPSVEGFTKGLFAQVLELIFDVMVTALNSVSSATGAPNMLWFIALFSVMDIVRNVIACFFHTQFAIGNVIGNIFVIFLFYGAIETVSPEAANSSIDYHPHNWSNYRGFCYDLAFTLITRANIHYHPLTYSTGDPRDFFACFVCGCGVSALCGTWA